MCQLLDLIVDTGVVVKMTFNVTSSRDIARVAAFMGGWDLLVSIVSDVLIKCRMMSLLFHQLQFSVYIT